MINKKMYELGNKGSDIRELFEYGKKRKALVGNDNVFDFSLGNPNVSSPKEVNETLIKLLQEEDSTVLHGYTSAPGDINVRKQIASYLNDTYSCAVDGQLIYLTVGAAAALTISLNAIINEGDEVVVIAPYFPEYKVFIEKANGIIKVVNSLVPSFKPDLNKLSDAINENTNIIT